MFKKPLFKILGTAALTLSLTLGLISAAGAAGYTSKPGSAPTTAPASAPASAQAAACTTNAKWTGFNPKASENGLLVTAVAKGSPAANAGLAVDRIILSVNGKSISQQSDLDSAVAAAKAGEKLTLEVARDGGQMSKLVVVVGTNAGKPFLGITGTQVPVVMGPFTLSETTPTACTSKPFELSGSVARGLYVASVDANSEAAKAGLVAGDVIVDANGKAVGTPDVFTKMIGGLKAGTNLDLRVYNPLNKKFSDVKIAMGSNASLGAQLAVIVEPTSNTASAVSSGSHMGILREAILTMRGLGNWLRLHLHFHMGY